MSKLPACYGIIPARYRSARFPGKPLADILGRPMIWHVFQRASQCSALLSIVLATDDDRIQSVAETLDIPVVRTRADHPSGTDRVLEAAEKLKLAPDAVVVNIQGDEPALKPAMLSELVNPFRNSKVLVTTLARKISAEEAQNPDIVKVVFAADNRAMYFSRSVIPYYRKDKDTICFGHIGIYALRMSVLKKFVDLKQTSLECTERLEQLRLLENNIPMHIVVTEHQSIAVDRPADIQAVTNLLSRKRHNEPTDPADMEHN